LRQFAPDALDAAAAARIASARRIR
jgi:hypothetical protein